MTKDEWFSQIAHAASVSAGVEHTAGDVAEWEKKYPVMKDGVQIGFCVPVGQQDGEFQVVTYEVVDFTKYDFRAMARD